MKKTIFLISLGLVLCMYSCVPSTKEAIAYNESIIDKQQEIEKKIAQLVDSYDNYVPEEMDSAYFNAHKAVTNGLNFIDSLKPFDNDSTYKSAIRSLFKEYLMVVENEHAKIISLLKLPQEQFQQKQIDEYDKLKTSAEAKIVAKIEETAKVQAEFAKKYNFKVDNPDESEEETK